MIVFPAAVGAALFGLGVFLLLQRSVTRVIIGLALLAHSANLLLVLAGGGPGVVPFVDQLGANDRAADPLPQALTLTAIVIAFAVTSLLLALAYRAWSDNGNDNVESAGGPGGAS